MTQLAIPYVFMRGGTSRGPYFNRADLPQDLDHLTEVLIAAIGSGHALNIDGIGGGAAVTTKVAMLSKSEDEWADIDYFFAQVSVEDKSVDFKPTCGNILSGVGSAAIELGLFEAQGNMAEIKIHAVNTGAKVIAQVPCKGRYALYDGNQAIAGVPGTGAAINLSFMETVGSSTGAMLPSGNIRDRFDDIEVTCMDVAMPMVIAKASDFGLAGHESVSELDENKRFFERMEAIRIQAGKAMGMGDVSQSVTPKFGLLAKSENSDIAARYFMPWKTHPSMAVTGAQCLAACALHPGSVADDLLDRSGSSPKKLTIEHASGVIDVVVEYQSQPEFKINSAGLVRTARKLADGHVYVPNKLSWK